ncbi:MAG: twin-arginine translocase TatA/TatE family subunit [Anaerolineae bacterium]|nr:twin-arginine translocase TatA/TatE family subunit [Anaerolineae bacterium]
MNSLFGIGLPELVTILILAGLVMGPQRIRQVARTLGQWTAVFQRYTRQFMGQLNKELDSMDSEDLRAMRDEIQQLRRQVGSLQDDFKVDTRKLAQQPRQLTQEIGQILDPRLAGSSSTPPSPLPTLADIPDDPEV